MSIIRKIGIGGILCSCLSLEAQVTGQFDVLLDSIAVHSPRIRALQARRDASREAALQSLSLDDPEVEFAYFWGDPAEAGHRVDLGISQSLDFPTVYLHRRRTSRQACLNAEWQYRAERQDVLLQAEQLCIEWVYYNAMLRLVGQQTAWADTLVTLADRRMAEGEMTVLDFNRLSVSRQLGHNDLDRLRGERDAVRLELEALNGGQSIQLEDTAYRQLPPMPATTFDEWFSDVSARSPMLQYVTGEVERARQELRTARSGWWPKLSVGYASEKEREESMRGVRVGVSVPVWSNRRRVRQARAELAAAEAEALDRKSAFMSRLQGLYLRAQRTQESIVRMTQWSDADRTLRLLGRAYEAGRMTRHEYLEELTAYYDVRRQLLSAQRDYLLLLAELQAVDRYSHD